MYEDRSVSVTLTDHNLLDCFICCDPLRAPIFHCKNGHTACFSCCRKLNKKCPICSIPIRSNRCSAVEKILDPLKVSCRNSKYGCEDTVSYTKINKHQKSCIYEPCFCPKCDVVASSKELSLHFSSKHMDSAIHFVYDCSDLSISLNVNDKVVIFQEQNDRALFVLNNYNVVNVGNAVNITCIAPSSLGQIYNYEVRARSHKGSRLEL